MSDLYMRGSVFQRCGLCYNFPNWVHSGEVSAQEWSLKLFWPTFLKAFPASFKHFLCNSETNSRNREKKLSKVSCKIFHCLVFMQPLCSTAGVSLPGNTTLLQWLQFCRFERLKIDCNDHLWIYDGAHDTGQARVGRLIFHICLQIITYI
jgi:hypothetical protein